MYKNAAFISIIFPIKIITIFMSRNDDILYIIFK